MKNCIFWRRGADLNRRIKVLQTFIPVAQVSETALSHFQNIRFDPNLIQHTSREVVRTL